MESMKLADEYGIYIGMSHHEPCMRSGAEYSKVRGKGSRMEMRGVTRQIKKEL